MNYLKAKWKYNKLLHADKLLATLQICRSPLCVNIDVAPKEETSNGLFARRETQYSEKSAAA